MTCRGKNSGRCWREERCKEKRSEEQKQTGERKDYRWGGSLGCVPPSSVNCCGQESGRRQNQTPKTKPTPMAWGCNPPTKGVKLLGGGIIKLKSSAYLTMTLSRPWNYTCQIAEVGNFSLIATGRGVSKCHVSIFRLGFSAFSTMSIKKVN